MLGRADARGGGAEDDRDARGAVALARRVDGVDEAVLLQAEPGEPVVAALPGGRAAGATAPHSRPATRPIQVASGVGPKSFGVRPLRPARRAACRAALPTPAALVTV